MKTQKIVKSLKILRALNLDRPRLMLITAVADWKKNEIGLAMQAGLPNTHEGLCEMRTLIQSCIIQL